MAQSTSDIKSARPGQSGTPVLVRLQPDQLAQLDAWIKHQSAALTRPEAVRRILAERLVHEEERGRL